MSWVAKWKGMTPFVMMDSCAQWTIAMTLPGVRSPQSHVMTGLIVQLMRVLRVRAEGVRAPLMIPIATMGMAARTISVR